MEKIINQLEKKKATCIFVSPHLDDAVFSCGALLTALKMRNIKTIVATVFTKGGNKNTLSAKAFLKQCGYQNGESLYRERMNEDKVALRGLSQIMHLGFVDALWRRKPAIGAIKKTSAFFVPALMTMYATYRWHIAKGKISKDDIDTTNMLKNKLETLIHKNKNAILFCPISAGNHVDHILIRDLCALLSVPVVYWFDYPYSRKFRADSGFINAHYLKKHVFNKYLKEKEDRMKMYKTQAHVIQPIKDRSELIEMYYTNNF